MLTIVNFFQKITVTELSLKLFTIHLIFVYCLTLPIFFKLINRKLKILKISKILKIDP